MKKFIDRFCRWSRVFLFLLLSEAWLFFGWVLAVHIGAVSYTPAVAYIPLLLENILAGMMLYAMMGAASALALREHGKR